MELNDDSANAARHVTPSGGSMHFTTH